MVLLLLLGPVLLPEFRPATIGRLDLIGAALSLVAVLSAIYGVKQLAVDGYSLLPMASLVAGIILGLLFVIRQLTFHSPLIDVRVFGNRLFSVSIMIKITATFMLTGMSLFTNQYLQLVMGMRPLTAALWSLTALPALLVAMSASVVLATKLPPVRILVVGLVVIAVGLAVVSQVHADSQLWLVLVGAATVAAGVMVVAPLVADLVLTTAPADRAGAASAVAETSDELGSALGMAILGSVGAAVYHDKMRHLAIEGAPAAVKAAQDTLAGAVLASEKIAGPGRASLLHAAKVSFTEGMNLAAAGGIAMVVLVGISVIVMLRRTTSALTAPVAPRDEPVLHD
jgi:DHA2 family multidrug resistance protein-like MFS transporter